MAAIHSLLNPAPESEQMSEIDPERPSTAEMSASDHRSCHHTRTKKQKICKDAAVFTRGPVRGECRYPPYEYQDRLLSAQHQQFELFPMGEIADYPRHIPYNSDKKGFSEKTGRGSLEVFQYNFKVPGDDTQYAMLWDYNIGLVRTTPLFKCTGHSKTTPAKMLNRNPGLREICHSVTGGALVAQGYWMPYDAAKAVAATFCWNIRYALTPVFGTDFPAICISPTSDMYGDMTIDPAITIRCTEQAKLYRHLETISELQQTSDLSPPLTPVTPTHFRTMQALHPRSLRDIDSDGSSDIDNRDSEFSPSATPEPRSGCGLRTPANTPRSVPRTYMQRLETMWKCRTKHEDVHTPASPELSPKSRHVSGHMPACDGGEDEGAATQTVLPSTRKKSNTLFSDEKAAYLLMSLKLQRPRGVKRRASA